MKECAPAIFAAALDLLTRRAGMSERNIVGDAALEQQALLKNQADVAAQKVEIELAHVDPVDQHPARCWIVKARNQLEQVLLPAPVAPTMAKHCPAGTRDRSRTTLGSSSL